MHGPSSPQQNAMHLRLVTPPDYDTVLTDPEITDHIREDVHFWVYAEAAMEYVQAFTRRAIGLQTWDAVLDEFPSGPIDLPLPPLCEVELIAYVDANGIPTELDAGQYRVDLVRNRVVPTTDWPAAKPGEDVTVRFTAGYADSDEDNPHKATPEAIRAAILLLAADLNENREAQSQDAAYYQNRTVDRLLTPYRVW